MPPSAITAISLVPPPTSTTSDATASSTGSSAPIAPAIASSIRCASRAPAASVASTTASRSTCVRPLGTHTITARRSRLPPTRRMKCPSICSVVSKSAITPCRSGRVATIVAGVRPSICRAFSPTAYTWPVCWSIATTDGSNRTMPSPRRKTTVFAVPRSTARSVPAASDGNLIPDARRSGAARNGSRLTCGRNRGSGAAWRRHTCSASRGRPRSAASRAAWQTRRGTSPPRACSPS